MDETQITIDHRFSANEMAKEDDLWLQYEIRALLRRAPNISFPTKIAILNYEGNLLKKDES